MAKIVAVTSCPTGIAHTYMAAEALKLAAKEMGHEIKVETRGAGGADNLLTQEDISLADGVIIAADTKVEKDRFQGKRVLSVSTGEAIKDSKSLIERVLQEPVYQAAGTVGEAKSGFPAQKEKPAGPSGRGVYKHLMTGVSYMIPLVVAGGLSIAMSFAFGIKAFEQEGSLAWGLMKIGGGAAFALMVPVLSAYMAYSIADRPGLAPGFIGGMLASQIGSGFLGGIASGFIAGYSALFISQKVRLPKGLQGLMPVLVIPLLSSLITGFLMLYVVGTPVKALMDATTGALNGMSSSNAAVLGLLLGAMMAFDMGGPVNKAAYTFAVGLLGSGSFEPMAAVMAAGMTPPLGIALASMAFPRKFSEEEREAAKAAGVLGISFITEGAIPFAASDPIRVIPSIVAGSALAGAMSMGFHCTLRAPHGGIFVLPIPGAVGNLGMYALSIALGAGLTALMLGFLKPRRD
ncbi:PTS system, fructose-specific, IIB component/PTS system, fructose subfamily, IIC component [Thermanaerovibrio velox DSM 12556]|uniref:PTS system, fructose-specific, IIB component/PTS system, fructose subfamily, IIC component n=1 Tax=Thermanaerovibrio velox DSM 12556 TaxID=926567 RepID=H0UN14_9BACT|nr:fructose-specific PTS transporter subunit EIIC [Thermanaerovibrio velox]EHM09293.1 PTS system, fructose-specific, IIB component/PTS system, fructose subfamily, IIC component [Thermanaerovibrio velox DSM 12556]